MDFINRENQPKFIFTPTNAKLLHPLLNHDNYLTYALALAYNPNLSEEEKAELQGKMTACYKREEMEFAKLEEQKLISNDITEEISNE